MSGIGNGASMRMAMAAVLLALPGATQAANFDTFLRGFEHCAFSPAFGKFRETMEERYENDSESAATQDVASVKIAIPAGIAAGVGIVRPVNRGSHTQAIVPLEGTFRGLAVQEIEFIWGNRNGLYSATLRFKADQATVRAKLGRAIDKGNAALAKNRTGDEFKYIFPAPGAGGVVFCDYSV